MARQNVIIMGTGNIGTEFLKQVAQKDTSKLEVHANPTNVAGMVNRGGFIWEPGGIAIQNDPNLIAELQGCGRNGLKDWLREQNNFQRGGRIVDIFNAVTRQGMMDEVVFIDLTAEDITGFHQKVIESGGKIVTANKIPVAQSSWEVFKLLTQFRKRYGYSCSVMAGAGAIPFLQDSFDTGDEVASIEGCFSGTLGKLCNLMHEGKITFSEAVAQLRANGDTEPDPRDDLSGMDVAKKLVILARTAGYHINMEDVTVEPFIPGGFRELSDCETEEFMAGASIFNNEISGRFESAKAGGKTLRYVARLKLESGKPVVTIGLREEELDSPLGSLKGNENKIVVYTKVYREKPYNISAPGSGMEVTANNIRRNLLGLLPRRER